MSASLMKSTGVVGLFTLISRALGFIREIMFATAFGAGGGMDAFLIALKIPNFGRRLFAEGAFSQAFVPVFTQTRQDGGDAAARDLLAVVAGTLSGILAVITLLGSLGAPWVLWLFAPGFSHEPGKMALGAELLRVTFPYLLFISLTALVSGVLNSYGRFGVPAATPILLNVCLIGSAFVDADSVHVLAWAVFVAGIVQLGFQLPTLVKLGLAVRPRWGWHDARVRRIVNLMVPVMFASSVAQISLLLDTILASFLKDGSVSWLYYSDRLMEFPLGVFTIALSTVILPKLSGHFADGAEATFNATLDWALRLLLLVGLPAAIGLFVLSGPLVITLFQHGEFNDTDVDMTRWALMAYAGGFLGFSMVKVLVTGFYARQETRKPVRIGVTALISTMVMSAGFTLPALWLGASAPHAGLALSTSMGSILNASLLFRQLRRDGIYRPLPGWGPLALRLLVANALLAGLLLAFGGALSGWMAAGTFERGARLLALIVAAVVIYFGALAAMGVRPRQFYGPRAEAGRP